MRVKDKIERYIRNRMRGRGNICKRFICDHPLISLICKGLTYKIPNRYILKIIARAVRYLIVIWFLYMAYHETGMFTLYCLILMFVGFELRDIIDGLIMKRMNKNIEDTIFTMEYLSKTLGIIKTMNMKALKQNEEELKMRMN